MMSEPLIDEPEAGWPEARGPHLPDAVMRVLTRVPPLAWPFLGLALLVARAWVDRFRIARLESPLDYLLAVVAIAPGVIAVLIGAAVFARHRDALRRHRILVFGVTLLAFRELLRLIDPLVSDAILSSTADLQDDLTYRSLTIGWNVVLIVLQGFGVLYLARGLDAARRWVDDRRGRVVIGVALVAGLSVPIGDVLLQWDSITSYLGGPALAAVWVGAQAVVSLALAYLAVIATRGYQATEDLRRGWLLAAVAAWALVLVGVAGLALNGAITWFGTTPDTQPWFSRIYQVLNGAYAGGWLALLAAFVVGLPADLPDDVGEDADGLDEPDTDNPDDIELDAEAEPAAD